MIFNMADGAPVSSQAPQYTYTGTKPKYSESGSGSTLNWELEFTGNCTITFSRVVPEIDVFVVGAGTKGASGSGNTWEALGGAGGKGGVYKTKKGVEIQPGIAYTVKVGTSSGANSSGFGVSSSGGTVKTGGAGGHQWGEYTASTTDPDDGNDGGYAFGGNSGKRYGGSGAGGVAQNGYHATTGSASGGAGGGGASGKAGTKNTGGGGGGGISYWPNSSGYNGPGGAGGSGIVIIRNARG